MKSRRLRFRFSAAEKAVDTGESIPSNRARGRGNLARDGIDDIPGVGRLSERRRSS
jgi:hypothetical protein